MSDYKKATQIINYLLRKDERASSMEELKVIKLIWAADRYHLRKYARTVSGDTYFAMKNGPVGSLVKDVAEFSDNSFSKIDESDFPYLSSYFRYEKNNENAQLSSVNDVDYDELSQTDIEALDFAWDTFGKYNYQQLIEFTHLYPEWDKHRNKLQYNKREDIDLIDFFKDPDLENDPFAMDPNTLNNARELYLEYC